MTARRARAGLAAAILLAIAGCMSESSSSPPPACPTEPPTAVSAQAALEDASLATVTVTGAVEGEFSFELYGDEAPLATANFVNLARCGFYDGVWFHRILAGFVIQAGDPGTKGVDEPSAFVGQGGPGYRFEIEPPAEGLDYGPYSVSMANAAPSVPDSNGSQFFVALTDLSGGLPREYTIFGQVVSGTDVVDAIAGLPVNDPQTGLPLELATIESIVISGGGEPSPSGE